ncbi:MAG: DUF2934 domain-containing protein [Phycisphaeraceae bacterium]|nr:DUF2934 domain-containing protein [Phycisphaeraceae bacterium]
MKNTMIQKKQKTKNDAVPFSVLPVDGQMKVDKRRVKAKKRAPVNSPMPVAHDMIAQRAWSIWMSNDCVSGQDEPNWSQAVLELDGEMRKETVQ